MDTASQTARQPASQAEAIITPQAMRLVTELQRRFNPRRLELLAARQGRQAAIDAGAMPDFLPETAAIRAADWNIAPVPADLQDRRVEITGPVERKMMINALNSAGAGLHGRLARTPAHRPGRTSSRASRTSRTPSIAPSATPIRPAGKHYSLNDRTATLIVRPRGWHLVEKHVRIDGEPVSASLFDFGVYLANNHESLARHGTGPYFYLPKMESHLEARLWNDVLRRRPRASGHAAGNHQGHGAHRDHSRRLRDGRDPLRTARAFGRPELRPLGLHLQLHQEIPRTAPIRPARPRHGDHGSPLPEVLCGPADPHLPPARRPRHGRHGGPDSRSRTTRWPTRRRWPRCAPTSCARPATATTAPGSPIRASRAVALEAFDDRHDRPEPDRSVSRDDVCGDGGRPAAVSRTGRSPSRACATTSVSASSTWRPGWAGRAACRSIT